MGRIEIDTLRANGEADFSMFAVKWLQGSKTDRIVTRGRFLIHLQKASQLSKEWEELTQVFRSLLHWAFAEGV